MNKGNKCYLTQWIEGRMSQALLLAICLYLWKPILCWGVCRLSSRFSHYGLTTKPGSAEACNWNVNILGNPASNQPANGLANTTQMSKCYFGLLWLELQSTQTPLPSSSSGIISTVLKVASLLEHSFHMLTQFSEFSRATWLYEWF